MAVTSGFFNSLYGDRKYTAEQFSALFNGLINDGVFSNIGTAFRVTAATDNNITIGIGRAWFNGIWVNNDALLPMTCNDPEVLLDRIDAVVIEINRTEAVRAGRIIFVKGTASGTPVNPTLTHDEGIDQYPLAYIRRKAGVSAVVQADITNCIGTSACPYVAGILETQNIDSIVAQWESEFDIWFDGLQVELSGDVAANLASQIIELNARFTELAENRTVTVELQDSSLDTILDSTGNAILGSTVLESEGSSSAIIVAPDNSDKKEESAFKVGDTLTTARLDLGEEWRLCNGASLSASIFTELANVIHTPPETPFGGYSLWDDASWGYGNFPIKIRELNGHIIAVGTKRTGGSSSDNVGMIAVSTSFPISKSNSTIKTVVSRDYAHIVDVVYGNGYYVALAVAEKYVGVVYATDPTGSWTLKRIFPSGGYDQNAYTIKYVNGYFVICGSASNYNGGSYSYTGKIAFTNGAPSSAWTTMDVEDKGAVIDVNYFEGKYVFLLCAKPYSNSSLYCGIKDNITSSAWTELYMIGSGGYEIRVDWSDSWNNSDTKIHYANGVYYVVSSTNNQSVNLLFKKGSILSSGTWTVKTVHTSSDSGSAECVCSSLIDNGYIIVLLESGTLIYAPVELATTSGFKWITVDAPSGAARSGVALSPSISNYYIFSCRMTESSDYTARYYAKNFSSIKLPTISSGDSLYTYIKVRSEVPDE